MKINYYLLLPIGLLCMTFAALLTICVLSYYEPDFEAGNVGVLEGVEFSNGMCHVTLSGEVFHVAGLGKSSVEIEALLGHTVKLTVGSGNFGYLDLFEGDL